MSYNLSDKPEELVNEIFRQAVDAVMPVSLMEKELTFRDSVLSLHNRHFPLESYEKLHVLGCGKGVRSFYEGFKKVVDHPVSGGILVCPSPSIEKDGNVFFLKGTHPVPDKYSLNAGKAICSYARDNVGDKDLVVFLLTGGASSLMVNPAEGLELNEVALMNRLLLESGAEIEEINCVRKHMSAIKGGRLAEILHPAEVVVLVLSDVIGSPLEAIGSGPLYGDSTSFEDAWGILKKYGILEKADQKLIHFFLEGQENADMETPFPGSEKCRSVNHFILGDNFHSLKGVKEWVQKSTEADCFILTSTDSGEASEVAKFYCSILKEILNSGNPFKTPVILLAGGELTVTIKGDGKGGRNQEFVLAALEEMKEIRDSFLIASFGTDGIDGPTDAAGAWINHKTYEKTRKAELKISEYLQNNDAWNFFKKSGNLIKTGGTGTNVMDVRVFIAGF